VTAPADDLALVLRQGRAALGGGDATRFPQPRMADLLGVSLRQYQRWENGTSHPPARERDRILGMLERADLVRGREPSSLHDELATLRAQVDALRGEVAALRSRLA